MENPAARRGPAVLAYLALALAIFAWFTVTYRAHPWFTPDTEDYLLLAPHRPVGYGLVLNGLLGLGLGETLRFLPQIQAALLIGALAAFARAVGRATGSLPAGLAVLGLPWLMPDFANAPATAMTEAPFVAATLGAATLCLARELRPAVLLGIGACLGAAILLRTTGFAAAFAVLLFLSVRMRRGLGWAILPVAAAWLFGASVQAGLNGRFEMGSFGGAALIGKAALLADGSVPLPEALEDLPLVAAEARELIAAAPHGGLAARLRLHAYEDLHWLWIWPRAEAGVPGWDTSDPRTWNAIAGRLATELIRADLAGYARLAAQDYVALFAWPVLTTRATLAADRRFLEGRPRSFIAMGCAPAAPCWPVLPEVPAVPTWFVLLPVSLAALPLSVIVLGGAALAAIGLAAWPDRVLLLSALLLQAHAVVTGLAEGGVLRYAVPLVPFATSLVVVGCVVLARRMAGDQRRAEHLTPRRPAS